MIQAASKQGSRQPVTRRGPRQLRIGHPDELAGLSVYPWRRSRSHGRLCLADPSLDQELRGDWEKRLNYAIAACGCGEASLGLITGLLIGGGWVAWGAWNGEALTAGWIVPVAAAVIVSLAGKTVGLMRGQAKLERLTRSIRKEWRAPPKSYPEPECG